MIKDFIKRNSFRRVYYGLSIRKRLIIYFILSILIPTSIISITVYDKSKNIIRDKINLSIEKNMNTISDIVLQKFEIVYDISTLITYNGKVLDILSSPKDKSAISNVNEMNELNTILDSYYVFDSSYMNNNTMFPRIYMLNRQEYNQYKISDKIFDISKISDSDWYKSLPSEAFCIAGLDRVNTVNGDVDTIKVARKLYKPNDVENPYAALLTIDMETSYFNDVLEKSKMSSGSSIFIIDDQNRIITKSNNAIKSLMASKNAIIKGDKDSYNSYLKKIDGVDMLVSTKHIDKLSWNIVSISPVSELNKEIISINKVVGFVMAVCSILSIIAALFLSEDVSRPILQLVKSMATIKNGNFDIKLNYKRNDEFAFLVSQYKSMMEQIRELIDKLYISELKKNKAELKMKDSELKVLLAQINPHFLYNTLDSINWLAIKYNVEDISIMVKSLSNFFRYSLNHGKNIISLKDEKNQVESYLKIQCARFKDMLDYYIDFEPEVSECYTVKLILQPLVENAIIHGIEEKNDVGLIGITGKIVDGVVEINIWDNGVGADVDKLNRIIEDSTWQENSLGIKNVSDRIKHFFGEEYGIKYYKNKEGGTTVVLRLKVIKNVEEFYVENDNS